jgi:hypothetical protein
VNRTTAILAAMLCLAGLLSADTQTDPVEKARANVERHQGKREAKAEVELVRALVEQAGTLYSAGRYDEAAKSLREAEVALGEAQKDAEQYKHDIKQCDLILDRVERELKDEERSFASQDQPQVKALIKQVQSLRDRLLQILFETK